MGRLTKPRRGLLGPGLIAGASDDDPSGIATYSQAGAQFGFALLWTLVFSLPLMVAIQEISARMGFVTRRGVAGNLRCHAPAPLAYGIVALLALANIINLGADLGAIGAAVQLLCGGYVLLYVLVAGVASAFMEVFMRYARYAAVLKWLCLSLLSYVACVCVVSVPWRVALRAAVLPHPQPTVTYAMAIVAVLGTTISPYLFFWQSQQEVEERQLHPVRPRSEEFTRIRYDTVVGMGLSNLIAVCIVITAAVNLHAHGILDIDTAAKAAEALRAVAGRFAFVVFALGIVGTGLLTVPVLAGSAAYALGELRSWRVGLRHLPGQARPFYVAVAAATLLGVALNFTAVNPIRALYWSAVLNGIVAVPVMIAMMRLSTQRRVMGNATLPRSLCWLGWIATAVMALTVLALAILSLTGAGG